MERLAWCWGLVLGPVEIDNSDYTVHLHCADMLSLGFLDFCAGVVEIEAQ